MQGAWWQDPDGAVAALTSAYSLVGHSIPTSHWQARDIAWVITDASCGAHLSLRKAAGALGLELGAEKGSEHPQSDGMPEGIKWGPIGEAIYLEVPDGRVRCVLTATSISLPVHASASVCVCDPCLFWDIAPLGSSQVPCVVYRYNTAFFFQSANSTPAQGDFAVSSWV